MVTQYSVTTQSVSSGIGKNNRLKGRKCKLERKGREEKGNKGGRRKFEVSKVCKYQKSDKGLFLRQEP